MKPWPKWLLIIGLILCVGSPMAGLLFTVLAMIGAFHDLGNSGIVNPQDLANHIGTAVTATMAGLLVGMVIGAPCIIFAVMSHLAAREKTTPSTSVR